MNVNDYEFERTPEVLAMVKEVGEYLAKQGRASYSIVNIFHKFLGEILPKDNKDPKMVLLCKALAVLATEKIIRMDTENKILCLKKIVLLDKNGKDLKNTMIDDDVKSETFAMWQYHNTEIGMFCGEHDKPNAKCQRCIDADNDQICVNHNKVLSKCDDCKKLSKMIRLKMAIDGETPQHLIARMIKRDKGAISVSE